MVELWRVVAGTVAVALGVAWVVAPVRLSNLQSRVLYLGRGKSIEGTDRQRLAGRVTGLFLAALGVALALGIEL